MGVFANDNDPGRAVKFDRDVAHQIFASYNDCPQPAVVRMRDRHTFAVWYLYVSFRTTSDAAVGQVVNDCLTETNKYTPQKWEGDIASFPHEWGKPAEFLSFAQDPKGPALEQIEIGDQVDPSRGRARFIQVTRAANTKMPIQVDVLIRWTG